LLSADGIFKFSAVFEKDDVRGTPPLADGVVVIVVIVVVVVVVVVV
jgi:hypothetical protein